MLEWIHDALATVPDGMDALETPELLRVRASALLSLPQPDEMGAERTLIRSLDLARHQGAKAWELRTAMTLARLRLKQGRVTEARALLASIYDQFTEGFDTRDRRAAAKMLGEIRVLDPV